MIVDKPWYDLRFYFFIIYLSYFLDFNMNFYEFSDTGNIIFADGSTLAHTESAENIGFLIYKIHFYYYY